MCSIPPVAVLLSGHRAAPLFHARRLPQPPAAAVSVPFLSKPLRNSDEVYLAFLKLKTNATQRYLPGLKPWAVKFDLDDSRVVCPDDSRVVFSILEDGRTVSITLKCEAGGLSAEAAAGASARAAAVASAEAAAAAAAAAAQADAAVAWLAEQVWADAGMLETALENAQSAALTAQIAAFAADVDQDVADDAAADAGLCYVVEAMHNQAMKLVDLDIFPPTLPRAVRTIGDLRDVPSPGLETV
jgi:hypothetical protein